MTAPVTLEVDISTKIAMTAPVTIEENKAKENNGQTWKLAFVMPQKFTMETLPKPKNANITIRSIPAQQVAVVTFSGWVDEEKMALQTQRLEQWVVLLINLLNCSSKTNKVILHKKHMWKEVSSKVLIWINKPIWDIFADESHIDINHHGWCSYVISVYGECDCGSSNRRIAENSRNKGK